jgi:hypothetical protein
MGLEDIVKAILKPVENIAKSVGNYMPKEASKAVKVGYVSFRDLMVNYGLRPADTVGKAITNPVYNTLNTFVVKSINTSFNQYPKSTTLALGIGLLYLL